MQVRFNKELGCNINPACFSFVQPDKAKAFNEKWVLKPPPRLWINIRSTVVAYASISGIMRFGYIWLENTTLSLYYKDLIPSIWFYLSIYSILIFSF